MTWRAVVDLGSLSTEFLASNGRERIRRSVDTFAGGASLTAAGEIRSESITEEALSRIGEALADYRRLGNDHDATFAAVGTAAARNAANVGRLSSLVADRLGVDLRILDEGDEARLAFTGATSGSPSAVAEPQPTITIDIGGGSTEFAVGNAEGKVGTWSMPIGGGLVTETYLRSDPPRPEELSAALSVVELHVDDLHRELPAVTEALAVGAGAGAGAATVVGLGGVVTVAAVEVGIVGVDPLNGDGDGPLHGFELGREAVEDVFRTIATEARADRVHNPGLPPSRVDQIVGGCAVLVEIMRQLDLETVVVSQRGLADGVLIEDTLW